VGKFTGSSVIVTDIRSIFTLYFHGYFGKGSLSRSEPNFGACSSLALKFLSGEPLTDEDCSSRTEEHLQLGLEEAFFLSYALGCLQVQKEGVNLNLDEMWVLYSSTSKNFIQRYAAYHHFRALGWVVRSGIKFGTDFLLYKNGPDFFHASYSVKVIRTAEDETDFHPKIDWIEFSGLNRITESASKELVLCQVHFPDKVDCGSPKCLEALTMEELVSKRWVAAQERD